MEALGNNWIMVLLMAFILGLKHGMDPDHLAAIDGLTRYNASPRPHLSRWAGFLFSLGHGAVIVIVAVLLGTVFKQAKVPQWTEISGTCISILFLFLLGFLNLRAIWQSDGHHPFRPVGFRATFFSHLFGIGHPFLIICVGALFAISFDTLSQAALFSLLGSKMAGWACTTFLGIVFMVGMMTPDALNGLWISRLARQTDHRARKASQMMGGTIAALSLLIGTLELIQAVSPAVAAAMEDWQLWVGIGVLVLAVIGFGVALRFPLAAKPFKTQDVITRREGSRNQAAMRLVGASPKHSCHRMDSAQRREPER